MTNKETLRGYIDRIIEKSNDLKYECNKDNLYKGLQDVIHYTRRAVNLLDTMYLNK